MVPAIMTCSRSGTILHAAFARTQNPRYRHAARLTVIDLYRIL